MLRSSAAMLDRSSGFIRVSEAVVGRTDLGLPGERRRLDGIEMLESVREANKKKNRHKGPTTRLGPQLCGRMSSIAIETPSILNLANSRAS
jgi:hypothetical protein